MVRRIVRVFTGPMLHYFTLPVDYPSHALGIVIGVYRGEAPGRIDASRSTGTISLTFRVQSTEHAGISALP